MKKHYVNDGLVNVIKGLLVIICMISLMDSMNKDVQADQVSKTKEDVYYQELKEKREQRIKLLKAKYGRKPAVETWSK